MILRQRIKMIELQYRNDRALLRFWKAVEQVKYCRQALDNSDANINLVLAERERGIAEAEMITARMQFLEARSPIRAKDSKGEEK